MLAQAIWFFGIGAVIGIGLGLALLTGVVEGRSLVAAPLIVGGAMSAFLAIVGYRGRSSRPERD